MSDTVIQIDQLSKLYRLGAIGVGTLRSDINRWWAKLRGRPDPRSMVLRHNIGRPVAQNWNPSEEIWALKEISFEVKQGEVLGIIGRNGAGKSTLLKILSRVTAPTSGEVRVKGRIASLLEVGTGFHYELTGRENVFLNGAILGMTKAETKRKFDEIVAFSEVEKFIDTPVKRYSSGMTVRLAFAVAAHLDPEILIVDEVLAVGDVAFQEKCIGKMRNASAKEGRTVLFVSHNLQAVQSLCSRGVLLESGTVDCNSHVDECLKQYMSRKQATQEWSSNGQESLSALYISKAKAVLQGTQPEHVLCLDVELISQSRHKPAFLAVDIQSPMGISLMQAIPRAEGFIDPVASHHLVHVRINLPPLIPGKYVITLWVGSGYTQTLDLVADCLSFEIEKSPIANRSHPHTYDHGHIVPHAEMEYSQL